MSKQTLLSDLLRDSAYKLTQFKPAQIQALEASITMKSTGSQCRSGLLPATGNFVAFN
jgi:type I restriction enzyme M protein